MKVQQELQVAEPTAKFFRSRSVAEREKTVANVTSTLIFLAAGKLTVASSGRFVREGK